MDKFLKYFDNRYRESVMNKSPAEDGPLITISRQTGCDGRQVAEKVVENLNKSYCTTKWKWIDKDILYNIAKELGTDIHRVECFYKAIELSNLSEMIMAFSGNFVTDQRVKKAVKEVVLSMCKEGHVVLVGRAGVSITQEIKDSLHIRLVAPFYWRVENVMLKKKMDIEAAEEFVVDTDEKRFHLIQTFLDKKSQTIDHLFDATINRSSFTIEETADFITNLYEKKISRKVAERRNVI